MRPVRLLAGEYPASLDPAKSEQKRKVLREAGVDSIVDLTEAGERPWGGAVLEPYHEPLCTAADALGVGRPVYARRATPDTSVTAVGGLDYPAVLDRIAELRAGTRKAGDPTPEAAQQRAVLQRLAARRKVC